MRKAADEPGLCGWLPRPVGRRALERILRRSSRAAAQFRRRPDQNIPGQQLLLRQQPCAFERLEIRPMQLCLMRCPGRALMAGEIPPKAMLNYVAEHIGADPAPFDLYARREERA